MTAGIEDMIANPFDFFATAQDVVRDAGLGKADKLRILHAMEHDARELQVAEEENMGGGGPPRLGEIRRAIRSLDPEAAEDETDEVQTSKI